MKAQYIKVIKDDVVCGAHLSDCGTYRYQLSRIWDKNKPLVGFIMLNPSTADSLNDDPTVRRCVGFAKSWGYGGIYIVNLFAYRSSNPRDLLAIPALDAVGYLNQFYLEEVFDKADFIVCAWGNQSILDRLMKRLNNEYKPLAKCFTSLCYLELSKNGTPKHPLYLKADCKLLEFSQDDYYTLRTKYNS